MATATLNVQTDTSSFNVSGTIPDADAASITKQIADLLTTAAASPAA